MKEREPNLTEQTLTLWETLEEAEDLYLSDYPDADPSIFRFPGGVEVSINFICYEDNRDMGIGAISISKDQEYDGTFRKDIVIRRKSAGQIESIVREKDNDPAENHLPGDRNYPYRITGLFQPISYYERLLDDSKTPNATYRRLTQVDIEEALSFLSAITVALDRVDYHNYLKKEADK